jgi:uncharacterized protein YdeI (YjbR/CyaY-like superfamily)
MQQREELYFKNDVEWRAWLAENYDKSTGVYLIFYKVSSDKESMRWEEAVKVALCYGWIDSTVKRLDEERRRQYFCPRKPKSVWSKLNKTYLVELIATGKMHDSGSQKMITAMKDGSWTALDDVENLIVPEDLQKAFDANPKAHENYQNFSRSYRKNYLYWLNQAKREVTREKRITEIIRLCAANVKSRNTR